MFSSRRNFSLVALYSLKFTRCSLLIRRGYSISKRLVRLNRFKSFPLQLSGHQDIPLLSFVRVASSTLIRCGWVFISARSVENYIPVERLNTLNTDLQSLLQKIKKSAAGETRSILTNTRSSRSVNFAVISQSSWENAFAGITF